MEEKSKIYSILSKRRQILHIIFQFETQYNLRNMWYPPIIQCLRHDSSLSRCPGSILDRSLVLQDRMPVYGRRGRGGRAEVLKVCQLFVPSTIVMHMQCFTLSHPDSLYCSTCSTCSTRYERFVVTSLNDSTSVLIFILLFFL